MLAIFRWLASASLLVGFWFGVGLAQAQSSGLSAQAQSNVLFIFDASGSMKAPVGNDTRIGIAEKAMAGALTEMPADVRIGMYGHRRANDCTDIERVSPIGADEAGAVVRRDQDPVQSWRQAARSSTKCG